MPDQKLSDFLTDLAQPQNHERLKRYLKSKEDRDAIVDASQLPSEKKNALKANNFKKVKEIVEGENPGSEIYLVPMGQHITTL